MTDDKALKEFQRRFRRHRDVFFHAVKRDAVELAIMLSDDMLDDSLDDLKESIVRKLKPRFNLGKLWRKWYDKICKH